MGNLKAELEANDPLLGPVLAASNGSASATVLAVLVKGIAIGLSTGSIRLWLRSRGGESGLSRGGTSLRQDSNGDPVGPGSSAAMITSKSSVSDLIADDARWNKLCSAAKRHVLGSPSLTGDVRASHLATATKLVAALLLPLPLPDGVLFTKNMNIRLSVAGLGLALLSDDKGWDTSRLSQPKLGMQMGWNPETARRSLYLAIEQGLVQRTTQGKGVPGRYKLRGLSRMRDEQVGRWSQTIDALADRTPDPVADVIRAAVHPVFGYGASLDHRDWVALIADVAEIDLTTYKMRRVMHVELTSSISVLGAERHSDLLPRLDALAADSSSDGSALERFAQAEAGYLERADIRKAEVLTVQAQRRKMHAWLTELFARRPIPHPPHLGNPSTAGARRKALDDWLTAARNEIVAAEKESSAENAVNKHELARLLKSRLVTSKYGESWSQLHAMRIIFGTE